MLYVLVNTHKLPSEGGRTDSPTSFEVRPIIIYVGGRTDRISWVINPIYDVSQRISHLPRIQVVKEVLQSS